MNHYHLSVLLLRLLGIYCIIQAVPLITMNSAIINLSQMQEGGARWSAWLQAFFPAGSLVVMGTLLLSLTPALAKFVASPAAEKAGIPQEGANAAFEDIARLVFAGVGAFIFIETIPNLPGALDELFRIFESRRGASDMVFRTMSLAHSIGIVVQAILGLLLFFKARGFTRFWLLLRTAATPGCNPCSGQAGEKTNAP